MSLLQEIGCRGPLIIVTMALITLLFFPNDPENPA